VTTVEPSARSRRNGRTATSTSNFGVSRRESHDASAFYDRFGKLEISDDDQLERPAAVDRIWCGDARQMDQSGQIADGSVALMVTSPPYFAGKEYEEALGQGHVPATFENYLQMLEDVFAECKRKLEPGGRMAINVANLGRKPYRSLAADVIDILQRRLGLLLRGEVVWVKSRGASGSCAWGTYQRPGNPVLRDLTERVIIASKGRFDRARTAAQREQGGWPSEGSLFMDEFMDATTDIWEIPPESATRVGHPAPFPVELPRRLIDLYTYRGDLVLDPFMGSGSTAIAAVRTDRHFVGFDTDPAYVEAAEARVETERARLADAGAEVDQRVPLRAEVPAVRTKDDEPDAEDLQARAVRQGRKAKELAGLAIERAGFSDLQTDVKYSRFGIEVTFQASDKAGNPWLFDVSGAFSSTRPGLKRADTLWKALGKAAVLQQARDEKGREVIGPLVLLSTDVPAPGSAGMRALKAVTGPDLPVREVIELLDVDGVARLGALADTPGHVPLH
jgi:site-specific DNA-methyltransferase (adenine-specific)